MSEEILAPMPGKIIKLNLAVDTLVDESDEILIIEAMKMETPVYAPFGGKITSLNVKEGDEVDEDDLIAVIEPS